MSFLTWNSLYLVENDMDDPEELATERAEIDVDGKLIQEVKLYPYLVHMSYRLK